jgi:membrane fusion protein (multidrug efflux system)
MNGLVNPKLARLNLEPISATHKGFKSGSSGIIRLPIVQNDVIVIPQKAVLKCRKTNCLRCWEGNKVKSRIIETNGTSG